MKRDWIKLDTSLLDDPRYGTLTDDLWKLIIQLMLQAGETDQDGLLPPVRDLAWILRTGAGTLQISLHQLCERGLLHSTPEGWVVTGFKQSQAAPNSTERSRAFRKRRRDEMEEADECNPAGTDLAAQTQPVRPYPVAGPVPAPVAEPTQPDQAAKGRRRHNPKLQSAGTCPVDTYPAGTCPVDVFPQEKGRKNSDPDASSTTSSLTNFLSTGLNIKLPLLELLDQPDLETESEKFRPFPENRLNALKNSSFMGTQQAPPDRIEAASENFREPVDANPVDTNPVDTNPVDIGPVDKVVEKPVDANPVNAFSQDKGRKNSDPDDIPP